MKTKLRMSSFTVLRKVPLIQWTHLRLCITHHHRMSSCSSRRARVFPPRVAMARPHRPSRRHRSRRRLGGCVRLRRRLPRCLISSCSSAMALRCRCSSLSNTSTHTAALRTSVTRRVATTHNHLMVLLYIIPTRVVWPHRLFPDRMSKALHLDHRFPGT